MGGWFQPVGHYLPEELDGLPVSRFIEAVQAEGSRCGGMVDWPLHLHPVFNDADIYHDGKPTRIAFSDRDVRQGPGTLPVAEGLRRKCLAVPWFKHDVPEMVELHAAAYRKVALQASSLAATRHEEEISA